MERLKLIHNGIKYTTWLLFVFLLVCSFSALGQSSSSIHFYTPESFTLFVNGEYHAEIPTEFSLDSISSGKNILDLVIADSIRTTYRSEVFIIEGQHYDLSFQRDSMNAYSAFFGLRGQQGTPLPLSLFITDLKNCLIPPTDQTLNECLNRVKKIPFESQRMLVLKRETAESCFTVAQLNTLVRTIDDDENRFNFLSFAAEHCYDRQHFYRLAETLDLQRFRNQFNQKWPKP
jgi:hypothetical protein